jgi:hypothetical protein
MSDDEVRCLADDLLREAADAIEFPKDLRVQESGDTLTFILSLESAEITYKPQVHAEHIVRQSEEHYAGSVDNLPAGMGPWLLRALASACIKQLLSNFQLELGDLLSDLPTVAEAQGELLTGIGGSSSIEDSKRFERLFDRRRLVGHQLRNREQRLCKLADERRELIEPPLLMISVLYEHLLPIWQEVKRRHRRYSELSTYWREHLTRDFAEHDLPSDLLDKLDVPKSSRGNYEAQPSALALEHSARRCGLASNQFGKRKLLKLLNESRAWKATCAPEELNSELVKLSYLEHARRAVSEANQEIGA